MENKFSSNFERKLSNSSVNWKGEGDLYNVDKITDFPLNFTSKIKHSFNRKMSRTLNGK